MSRSGDEVLAAGGRLRLILRAGPRLAKGLEPGWPTCCAAFHDSIGLPSILLENRFWRATPAFFEIAAGTPMRPLSSANVGESIYDFSRRITDNPHLCVS